MREEQERSWTNPDLSVRRWGSTAYSKMEDVKLPIDGATENGKEKYQYRTQTTK